MHPPYLYLYYNVKVIISPFLDIHALHWILNAPFNSFLNLGLLSRGVRSDAQLSCTETRFQKCSQSGKNGSKHPMLSISMADNVISYKKNQKKRSKNQNRWFYNVNSVPKLRNDQKSQKKNGLFNRNLLNFLYKYGIF